MATDDRMATTQAERALKRMLANGPLSAIPKRPQDQDLLALMAASRFAPGVAYRESEVNEILQGWLATFSVPYGIDHVTLRRMMVDARLLVRTTSGSTYGVSAAKTDEIAAIAQLAPAAMLDAVREERRRRKQERRA
jgi:hypothetical protein